MKYHIDRSVAKPFLMHMTRKVPCKVLLEGVSNIYSIPCLAHQYSYSTSCITTFLLSIRFNVLFINKQKQKSTSNFEVEYQVKWLEQQTQSKINYLLCDLTKKVMKQFHLIAVSQLHDHTINQFELSFSEDSV